MAELSQMLRWNTKLMRGLAQSVLDKARVVRGSLTAYSVETPTKRRPKKNTKRVSVKRKASTRRKRNA